MGVFEVYVALWRRAEGDGLFVHYGGWPDEGLAGYFHPHTGTRRPPELAIRRPYYEVSDQPSRTSNAPPPLPQPDLVAELHTFAHEYGHSQSCAGRTDAATYARYNDVVIHRDQVTNEVARSTGEDLDARLRTALHEQLTDEDRALIMNEETLAWSIGREVLTELGYDGLDAYDAVTEQHLHNHRYRLGIEELWPEDG